jgi:thiamine phosphate synthase YjbQ (UPF0047 family)
LFHQKLETMLVVEKMSVQAGSCTNGVVSASADTAVVEAVEDGVVSDIASKKRCPIERNARRKHTAVEG